MSENLCNWQTKVQMNKERKKQTTNQTKQNKLHAAALLEKLRVPQLVRKFPALYETQRFITMFTTAHQLSISRARPIQSMTFQLISSSTTLILSSHLPSVPNGLFHMRFSSFTPAGCCAQPSYVTWSLQFHICGEYKSLTQFVTVQCYPSLLFSLLARSKYLSQYPVL